jgi:hypothetical protein
MGTPQSLDGFDHIIKAMADLMTLCAQAPSGALKRTLTYTGSDQYPTTFGGLGEVEVLGSQVYQPSPQSTKSRLVEYLFTLDDVPFEVIAPAWLTLRDKASTACNVLFGLKYISQGYVNTRLLSAASAAEALHRSLHDKKPYTDHDFKQLLKSVLAARPGKDAASKDARSFIRARLRNELTYRERLIDLAAIPDPEALKSLIPDIEIWADLLKDARNNVAHAANSPTERPELVKWAELHYALTDVTYAVMSIILMAELDLPVEVQRRAATTQPFILAAEHFAEALGQLP